MKNWKDNHDAARSAPRPGFEQAICSMIDALAEYATAHRVAYGSPLGSDGVIGDLYAKSVAEGLIGMLNGERGRLDGGLLDREIRSICAGHGIALEE